MRIALLAYGTRGDIQPALALGDTLRARGHSVVLTVNKNLVSWAERSGLDIVGTEPNTEALLKSEACRHVLAKGRMTDFLTSLWEAEDRAADDILRAMLLATEGADLVLTTALTMVRGGIVARYRDVPHGVVATMPLQPTGQWASMLSPWPQLGLGKLNWLSHRAFHELYWQRSRHVVRSVCEALDLTPPEERPRMEQVPSVHIYSDWLAPRPPDWSPIHRDAGFCFLSPALRERLGEGVPDELSRWLDAGPAPVFFGLGSMPVLDPEGWLDFIVHTTRRRGVRALIGAGWSDLKAKRLPEHVYVASAFDHDAVLPRCRAAVHHGGAGTTGAALRAGLPSFVLSVFADQPFWGWRLKVLGVGDTLPFSRVSLDRLDGALDCILDPMKLPRARRLGAALSMEQGHTRAAEVIESWASAQRAQSAA